MRNGGWERLGIPALVGFLGFGLSLGCSGSGSSRAPDGGGGSAGQGDGQGDAAADAAADVAAIGGQSGAGDVDARDAGDTFEANPDHTGPDGGGIQGLVSIDVAPAMQAVALVEDGSGLLGTAAFTATGHFSDGHTEDVTSRLAWSGAFATLHVTAGAATVTAPGSYTITAAGGAVTGTATLVATFSGSRLGPGFDPTETGWFDGTPTGAVTIAYPLDHAVLPPNLPAVQVQITRAGPAQTAAQLRFTAGSSLDLKYYARCQPAAGAGCYVDLPPAIASLFVAASETSDVTLTARVAGLSAPLAESPPIRLAWANLPLSGGLYYWAATPAGEVPGYVPPPNADNSPSASGATIWRYALDQVGAAPQLVYTDRGRSPTFLGSPPATADNALCIGCHAISGDGKTMALTVGGSSAPDVALLDLTTLTLATLDAPASAGAIGPADINYYKQFRKAGIATETAFGPNGDVMVNMYRSQLLLRGTSASLVNQGSVLPSWTEYKSDPFWSRSGKLFVFTSFVAPDVSIPYFNPTGLNGDMKRNGLIAIASASATAINDDARVLVAREPSITKYYPVVSADDQLVAYDQSTCGIDPDVYTDLVSSPPLNVYGAQTCDGYDDSSASLWLTIPTGIQPLRLDSLNGGAGNDTSHPQWGPRVGTFRGQRLYWLAFTSRRPYGLQLNTGAPLTTRPQIWLGAVIVGAELTGDPSRPAVWLPNQNPLPPGGLLNQVVKDNHTPQWVTAAVPLPN